MKRLFIIGNGFDSAHNLPTSYEHFRQFLIENYIGKETKDDMYFNVPEVRIGHHGEKVIDEGEVAAFLENIISMAEPNSEEWSVLEESLGKLDYGIIFDNVSEVYDKDGDIDWWKTSYNNENMGTDLREIIPYIKDFFEEWIGTIELEGICPNKSFHKLMKKDSIFLTFNYTETLETLYSIDAENICHIHGKQGQEIFFGHGDAVNYTEEYERYYLGGEYALSQLDEILRKDTELALRQNYDFFENIDDSIDEIYTIGFSFGEVDLIYIMEICKRISHKTLWYLNEYDKDRFSEFQGKIRECGFEGKFGSFNDKGEKLMAKEDKILDVLKEIERIYKIKHLNRMEKYNLIFKKCKVLNKEELRIFKEEVKRNCISRDDNIVKDTINFFFVAVGILVAIAAIYYENKMTEEMFKGLINMVGGYSIIFILLNHIIQRFKANRENKNRYILDILERYYFENYENIS